MASDLHIHTTASDGRLPPETVLQAARDAGLDTIAITDHDTVAGLEILYRTGLAQASGIRVFSGIEFSAHMPLHEVHILGYHIDIAYRPLLETLDAVTAARRERFAKMLAKLQRLGYALEETDVRKIAGDTRSIGRAHIAQALIDKGYFSRLGEAFAELLHKNGPVYEPHYRLTAPEIVRIVRDAGGVTVVAHPGLIGDDTILAELIEQGIDGIEAFHPKHSEQEVEKYRRIALEHHLLITGGSDFHGIPTRYPNRLGLFVLEDSYANSLAERRASL